MGTIPKEEYKKLEKEAKRVINLKKIQSMNATNYISLASISLNHQQEFLSRFDHPYETQDKDNSKV